MKFNKKLLIVFIIIILGIMFIPFCSKNYHSKKLNSSFNIPRFSLYKESKDKNIVTFITIKNKNILKFEMDRIINKLEKKTCHYDTYYYDKENDITIEDFKIDTKLLFNEISVRYKKGKYSNEECNIITDPTRIEYSYFHIDEINELKPLYKYLNKDGNLYDVYTTCDYCLSIKKGMGYFSYFEELLQSSYMSMDDLISFLEHQVETKKATKDIRIESTIYKNKDFTFIECNTKNGNKDIYFDERLDSSIDYCNN